jgi:hypothetical protein
MMRGEESKSREAGVRERLVEDEAAPSRRSGIACPEDTTSVPGNS